MIRRTDKNGHEERENIIKSVYGEGDAFRRINALLHRKIAIVQMILVEQLHQLVNECEDPTLSYAFRSDKPPLHGKNGFFLKNKFTSPDMYRRYQQLVLESDRKIHDAQVRYRKHLNILRNSLQGNQLFN